jgi:hypothetical protein
VNSEKEYSSLIWWVRGAHNSRLNKIIIIYLLLISTNFLIRSYIIEYLVLNFISIISMSTGSDYTIKSYNNVFDLSWRRIIEMRYTYYNRFQNV